MDNPAAMGFFASAANGHPPQMMENQNATGTVVMRHMDSMGAGGATLPPTATKWTSATTAPAASASSRKRIPLAGWERPPATAGCFPPHVTPMTITIGIKQIIASAIHVVKTGKAKSAMNPSETTITRTDDTAPRTGCFMMNLNIYLPFLSSTRLVLGGQVHDPAIMIVFMKRGQVR